MNEQRKLNQWLNQLDRELSRYFDQEETEEIKSYYEEMINDKLDLGQDIDKVLSQYQPKEIAKSMIPKIVNKRTSEHKKTSNNLWLILLLLFSTPFLIPLGIAYIVLMVVAFALMISGGAIIFGSLSGIILYIIESFGLGLSSANLLLTLGFSLVSISIVLFIGYGLSKIAWFILRSLVTWFTKLIMRRRENYETY